jgi:hypothetical protein
LELFKDAVEDWAIEEKFSTRLYKVATDFCVVKGAAEDSCPFSIRFLQNKEGFFAVIKLHAEHTCVGVARVARSVENTQRWLLRKVPEVIAIDGKMTPKQVVDNLRLKFGMDVNEKAAPRVAKEGHHVTTRGVPPSPAYIDELREANPGAHQAQS